MSGGPSEDEGEPLRVAWGEEVIEEVVEGEGGATEALAEGPRGVPVGDSAALMVGVGDTMPLWLSVAVKGREAEGTLLGLPEALGGLLGLPEALGMPLALSKPPLGLGMPLGLPEALAVPLRQGGSAAPPSLASRRPLARGGAMAQEKGGEKLLGSPVAAATIPVAALQASILGPTPTIEDAGQASSRACPPSIWGERALPRAVGESPARLGEQPRVAAKCPHCANAPESYSRKPRPVVPASSSEASVAVSTARGSFCIPSAPCKRAV